MVHLAQPGRLCNNSRMIGKAALVTAILSLAFNTLDAQNSTPTVSPAVSHPGKARILGAVIDSLNGGTLAGADVLVEGAKASAVTDSLGKFELDDLPPGNFQLGVFHPRLDTLGLSIVTRPFHIGPDSTGVVVMAVPSASTIIHERCPAQRGAMGSSAVIGHVTDPESLQPVVGAEVTISWVELEVSKSVGIRHTPH